MDGDRPEVLSLVMRVCCEHALERRPGLPIALRAAGLDVVVCPPGGAAAGPHDPETLVTILDDPAGPAGAVAAVRKVAPRAAVIVLSDTPSVEGADAVLPTGTADPPVAAVAHALARAVCAERAGPEDARARLAAIVESSDDAIISKDLGGIITSWNTAAERLFGYSAAEAIGHHITLIVPRELWDEEAEILARLRRGEKLEHYETVRRAKNGRMISVSLTISPMRDSSGRVIGASKIARDVGARRAATAAGERLAAIVESSDDAILSKNLRGVITSWNTAATRIFGYTAEEAIGRHITLIIPPERREEENEILARIQRGERIDHFETVRRAKDGRLLDVSLTISPVRDASGTIIGASKVARDITSQLDAQARLRASEERLRLAVEAGRIGVWEWDLRAASVTWSDRLYQIYGLEPCDFVPDGGAFERLAHSEDRARVGESLNGAIEHGADFGLDFRIVRPGGEIRWLSSRAEVVRDDIGRPLRMIGVSTDITEQRRLDEQLRTSESAERARALELEAMMDSAPAIVLMTSDPHCRAMIGNRAAYEALHLPVGSNIATSTRAPGRMGALRIFRDGQELPDPQLPLRRAAAGEVVRDEELEIRFERAPSLWVYGHATPIRGTGNTLAGAVGVFVDVSELKKTREELSSRVQDLARSNAELQDFAYVASHDLKEPLRGISAYAQFLLEDYGDRLDDEGRDKLVALVRLPKRMYALLDALLEYARLGRSGVDLADVDAGSIAEAAVDSLRTLIAERGAQVTVEHPLPHLRADRVLLGQALANLIANGVKYNRSGTPRVSIGGTPEGSLFVRDNGIGIPARHQDTIFRMFKRLHPRDAFGGGTGVGLAIVKRIVEIHGGRISVDSREGTGSTFFLSVPPASGNPAEAPDAVAHV